MILLSNWWSVYQGGTWNAAMALNCLPSHRQLCQAMPALPPSGATDGGCNVLTVNTPSKIPHSAASQFARTASTMKANSGLNGAKRAKLLPVSIS